MLELLEVSAGYGRRTVLNRINMKMAPGFHALVGPNGAGKTTLFRVVDGILAPWQGTVRVDGRDPHWDLAVRSRIAYVPQQDTLYPKLTVEENLRFFARLYNVPVTIVQNQIKQVVSELELETLLERRAGTLSGGEKRRVTFARALLVDPCVLLCDEPTTGLDPTAGRMVREILLSFKQRGRLLLVATHNLYEAVELADDVVLLHNGCVLRQETLRGLTDRLGGSRSVGFRVSGDPTPVFARLELSASLEDGVWVCKVTDESSISDIIAKMVASGCKISEVKELDNPLERLFDISIQSKDERN